jgi:phage terminase large subunit
MFSITTATAKVQAMRARIRGIQGGTSASKTISTLMYLIDLAQTDTTPTLTSVVSESLPHLKRGAIKDFITLLEQQGYYDDDSWNRSDFIYKFPSGSKIEFFSVDQPDKVRGPRRDRLFINEANNVKFESFDQLEVRTNEFIVCDWNPTTEFWYYTQVEQKRDDTERIILTYKDNEALNENIVRSIEQRHNRVQWWKVYGEGQLGEVEGRVYSDWQIIDEIPHEARLVRRCVDFGYTNDPTAIIDIYYYNGGYILDEIAYSAGMSNKIIADTILEQPQQTLVIADSSEPKSIDDIKSLGVNIHGAMKGPGSINQGVDFVQEQPISVTKRSLNVIKEYRGYLFVTDRDGKITNEPQDFDNHAMDAIRYGIASVKRPRIKTAEQTAADNAERERNLQPRAR